MLERFELATLMSEGHDTIRSSNQYSSGPGKLIWFKSLVSLLGHFPMEAGRKMHKWIPHPTELLGFHATLKNVGITPLLAGA